MFAPTKGIVLWYSRIDYDLVEWFNRNQTLIKKVVEMGITWMYRGFLYMACALTLLGCQSDRTSKVVLSPTERHLELFKKLEELATLRSWPSTDIDILVRQNEAIRQDIESIRYSQGFDALVALLEQGNAPLNAVVAPDGQLIVLTWETGLDRLGYDLKSIALFKDKGKVRASSLYGSPKRFGHLEQFTDTKGLTTYVLKTLATPSDSTAVVSFHAYGIDRGHLETKQIAADVAAELGVNLP